MFVEQRRDAVRLIRENLELTGLADRGRVVNGDAMAFLSGERGGFDLIFVDPPYALNLWEQTLEEISRFDILRGHGIIICECPVEHSLPERVGACVCHRTYRYGKIKITTYHREEQP